MNPRNGGVVTVSGLLALLVCWAAAPTNADNQRPQLRRPIALVLADGDTRLFVANQRSGSISVIDTKSRQIAAEVSVGRKLAALALTPDGTRLLAVDEEAGELLVLRRHGLRLETPVPIKVNPGPVSVQVAADGSRCYVASLWARRLTVVDLAAGTSGLHVVQTIALPFPPRLQLLLPGASRLVVASSFAGRLAVVDLARGEVESDRALPGHNIRGLALSADGSRLLVTHQVLNRLATTSRDDIHWGNLMNNCLRELPLANVRDPRADLLKDSRLHYLGDVDRGAGDPAGVATTRAGRVILALAGVGEVAIGGPGEGGGDRLAVGSRPTALTLSPDDRWAYVANTFADTISVIDLGKKQVAAEVALGQPAEPGRADRGEQLFYNARLSHDGWLSCQSCHTDGHSNGLLADTLSDGSYGTPKRVLSLLGVKDTGPWAWNGRVKELETQIRSSVQTTMQGRPLTAEQAGDLLAYLQTLTPPPGQGRFRASDAKARERGREVFHRQACDNCHAPPTYTSTRTFDVGLSDEAGNQLFNPPSLRGVSQGGPYFHDGRAATLADVLGRERHQLKHELTASERADLLAFLEDL
jgi:YVTN family beta-propeller protein